MNGCSALNLSPCFAPVYAWWTSVEAWWPWIEFSAVCIALLGVAALLRAATKSDLPSWTFLLLAFGLIEHQRGVEGESFNPIPPLPADKPAPKPKK